MSSTKVIFTDINGKEKVTYVNLPFEDMDKILTEGGYVLDSEDDRGYSYYYVVDSKITEIGGRVETNRVLIWATICKTFRGGNNNDSF